MSLQSQRLTDLRSARNISIGFAVAVICCAVGYLIYNWRGRQAERTHGLQLVRENKLAEAEPILTRHFERDRDDLEVVRALCKIRTSGFNTVADAEPMLTRWCELSPNDPNALGQRLDMWLRLSNFERALADADAIVRLDPNNTGIATTRITILNQLGRYAEAESEAARLIENAPTHDSGLRVMRATALHHLGRTTEAIDILDIMIIGRFPYLPAVLLLGVIHAEASPPEPDRAIPLLQMANARATRSEDRFVARHHLARMLILAGRRDEADRVSAEQDRERLAERLIEDALQQPENDDIAQRAAKACIEAARTVEALEFLNRLLVRNSSNKLAHQLLADIYEKRGEAKLAEEHRRQAGRP